MVMKDDIKCMQWVIKQIVDALTRHGNKDWLSPDLEKEANYYANASIASPQPITQNEDEAFAAWLSDPKNPLCKMSDEENPLPVTFKAGYRAGVASAQPSKHDDVFLLNREIHNLKRHIEDYCTPIAPHSDVRDLVNTELPPLPVAVAYCQQDFMHRLSEFKVVKANNGMWQKQLYDMEQMEAYARSAAGYAAVKADADARAAQEARLRLICTQIEQGYEK